MQLSPLQSCIELYENKEPHSVPSSHGKKKKTKQSLIFISRQPCVAGVNLHVSSVQKPQHRPTILAGP